MSKLNLYRHGQIVRLRTSFLGEPIGVTAYVYDVYDNGVCIITENGTDLGGFSLDEQHKYLDHVRDTEFYYQFKNAIQLDRDWEAGMFNRAFPIGNAERTVFTIPEQWPEIFFLTFEEKNTLRASIFNNLKSTINRQHNENSQKDQKRLG